MPALLSLRKLIPASKALVMGRDFGLPADYIFDPSDVTDKRHNSLPLEINDFLALISLGT